jgi:hypothetical protein
LHRIWAFVAGVPVGILAALASGGSAWLALDLAAAAGGFAMLLLVTVAGRYASPEVERAQLAGAASIGLAAIPAAAGAWLGLLPGARWMLAIVILAIALGLLRAMRGHGPRSSLRHQAAAAGAALAIGALATVAAAGVLAALGARGVDATQTQKRASAAFDVDASVALGPDPGCEAAAAATTEIARGARPEIGGGGAFVWFDALEADGRRQIHRLERATGTDLCFTCGEAGNNRRPRLSPNGSSVVFETDRHVSAFEPTNWELEIASAQAARPGRSRRLTYDPGPDTYGGFAPGGGLVAWSSGSRGAYAVATAGLRSGHGGLLLATPSPLVAGGASWVVPLAWSPDARALVTLRGDPLGVQETSLLDPATGAHRRLEWPGARTVAAGFSADGTRLAVATTRPAAASAALPKALGFLTARIAALGSDEPTRFRVSGVRVGATAAADLDPVALGEHEAWGHPTGIALEPDGRAFLLGQRSAKGDERILRVELRCAERP